MAHIRLSNTGGDWNNTATWDGGVVPTTADSIYADASSGNLTVNVSATILYFDFTNWLGLLTINSSITFAVNQAASTTTIGSGHTFNFLGTGASQGRITTSNSLSITQIGTTRIPYFFNNGTIDITNNLYVENLRVGTTTTFNNNNLYVSGNINKNTSTGRISGSSTLIYDGTGTYDLYYPISINFDINTAGTLTFLNNYGIGLGLEGSSYIKHTAGTIVNPLIKVYGTYPLTFELEEGTYWELYYDGVGGLSNPTIFTGTSYISNMIISPNGTTVQTLEIDGTGTAYIQRLQISNDIFNSTYQYRMTGIDLVIDPAVNLIIEDQIICAGLVGTNQPQTPLIEIYSTIPGTQATLTFNTYNQSVSDVSFTDIDCSGGNTLYGQNLTLSNTTNITQYTLPPSGGGGGGSFTFVN